MIRISISAPFYSCSSFHRSDLSASIQRASLHSSVSSASSNPGQTDRQTYPTMSSDSSVHNRDSVSSNNEAGGAGGADTHDKPRLTDQEKKNNHIASEQKRRAAIREGFDRLTELVPGLEGQGRSESVVLKKTVDFLRLQLEERRELIAQIERNGGKVDDTYRTR